MSVFNKMSEPEEERLQLLTEECAEVIQIAQKTLRFGFNSTHADYNYVTNQSLLTKELGDLLAAIKLLVDNYDIDSDRLMGAMYNKQERMKQYFNCYHIVKRGNSVF